MLKTLIKKQFTEVFRAYFFNAKNNTARSKKATVGWFIFYVAMIVVVLGGIFTAMSLMLCGGLCNVRMDWLYFSLMAGMSVVMGAFGSVFNTYSGLYLSKDNDLLLSMPIPVNYIIASRLINVYILGAFYSSAVILPALIVYWIYTGISFFKVICGIILLLTITLVVLVLSCLLGWVVAKISLKLKNNSMIRVILALLFIGLYYFGYFKSQELLTSIIANAETIGTKIMSAAHFLYAFGTIGTGKVIPALVFLLVTLVLLAGIWYLLSRSFIKIATSSANGERVKYKKKEAKQKPVFAAILSKEFGKILSSSGYMLNCCLGVILLPAAGIVLLIKGSAAGEALNEVFAEVPGTAGVLVGAAVILIGSMINTAAPSVSLEGKNIWIPQSMPVNPALFLFAKAAAQFIISVIPVIFTTVCAAFVFSVPLAIKLAVIVLSIVYSAFSAVINTFMSVKMPNLSWTNELYPIKQGASTGISIFGEWGVAIVFAGAFLLFAYPIGALAYLAIWTVIFIAATAVISRWLATRGAKIFSELQ